MAEKLGPNFKISLNKQGPRIKSPRHQRISILGCGWLGYPFANRLVSLGYSVKGSTTSPEKISILQEADIEAYHLECTPELQGKDQDKFFDSDILFLNIPFSRKLKNPAIYLKQVNSVCQCVKDSPIQFVIFASSTSVYPEDCRQAREDILIKPDNSRSGVLLNIEQRLSAEKAFQATILRFGGLYGGSRQVGKFMSGRMEVHDGPVNLVHLDDALEIVTLIIAEDIRGEVLNVCSDYHPLRSALYTKAAKALGLEAPQFSADPAKDRIVDNTKLKKKLEYEFSHPDPMDDIE